MINQEMEEWRSIEGYEGLYEVSNLGRVRSLDRYGNTGYGIRLYKGKILSPAKVRGDYLQVVLSKDCNGTMFKVHRLVAMAFQDICGQFIEGLQVDHRNCVRDDNRAKNLHWVTSSENQLNPITRQRKSDSMKGKFGKRHPKSKAVLQYDIEGNFLAEFEGQRDAERKLGISQTNICACCKGRYKTAGGYIFRYKTA